MVRYPKYDVQGLSHAGQYVWYRTARMSEALRLYHNMQYGRIVISGRTVSGPVNRDSELDDAMERVKLAGKIRER